MKDIVNMTLISTAASSGSEIATLRDVPEIDWVVRDDATGELARLRCVGGRVQLIALVPA